MMAAKDARPRSLSARTALTDGTATVRVRGEIDADTAPRLRIPLAACLLTRPDLMQVDLRAVTFCDCAGLNVLLWARRHAADSGTAFELLCTPPQVCRLLDLAGVADLLVAPSSRAGAAR